MSVDAAVYQGRRAMLALMVDRCRITKPGVGPRGEMDPVTLQYPEPERVVVYEGRCRLQVKADINSNVVETTAGDREWTYLTATLQLPILPEPGDIGSPVDVRTDYVVEYLVAADPSMVGRVFNIRAPDHKTHATHRRFRVREVVA